MGITYTHVSDDDMNYGTSIAMDEPSKGHVPQEWEFRKRVIRPVKIDIPSSSDEDEPIEGESIHVVMGPCVVMNDGMM